MNTLFFIRHAESEANKKRILASQLAFPLTEDGKADADLIAAELKEITEIDRIISSPLKRAVQTAESFGKVYNLEITMDERISEHNLGKYSGMSYDQVKTEPDYETDSLKRWDWVPLGGGESYKAIAERVRDFLEDLNRSNKDQRILIVTHAVTLRMITAIMNNTLPEYPKEFPNNGEILKIQFTGTGKVHEIESIMLGNSSKFNHNP